jgi:hypothetical protein
MHCSDFREGSFRNFVLRCSVMVELYSQGNEGKELENEPETS